jgi:CHAD domain-containing protein
MARSDIDPQEWLSNELRDRFDAVVDQRKATLDPDETHGVHDMRVAIRRLRSLMADFAEIFDVRPVKRIRKMLKNVAGSLGKVRDQDVYIKALEKLYARVKRQPHAHAVTKLIDNSRELRKEAHKKITKPLSKASLDDLSDRFSEAVDSALDQPGLFRPAGLAAVAQEAIAARLDELVKLGWNIYDPSDQKGLHKFRIAVKRLRYSMEAFAPVLKNSFESRAEQVAKLQSLLGDLHDCDVWIDRLGTRLKKMDKNGKVSHSDLKVLSMVLSDLVKRRARRYRSSLELWTEWETADFLPKIKAAVSKNGG